VEPTAGVEPATYESLLGPTVAGFLDIFKARYAPLATRPEYYSYPCRVINRLMGGLVLSEVGPEEIETFRATRLSEGASRPTVNRNVAVLSKVLRVAQEWGYIDQVPRVKAFRENPPRLEWLKREQAEAVLSAIDSVKMKHECDRPILRTFILALLTTACRRGELLSLLWRHVDLDRRTITLVKTKNGESRHVPIHASLLDALKALPRTDQRVFPMKKSSIRGPWRRACVAAGIGKFRLHALRHTAISWMVQQGTPLATVAAVAGHKSLSMTMRYSHMAPEHLRAAVDSIPALTSCPVDRE
jgi:integrase